MTAHQASLNRARDVRRATPVVHTATETGSEGQDTRDAIPKPLRANESLSMIYLREFERTHSTMRGKVRIARKAGHMLRMHWAHVRGAR